MPSVAEVAYGLWEARGRPRGDDWTDWFAAEERLGKTPSTSHTESAAAPWGGPQTARSGPELSSEAVPRSVRDVLREITGIEPGADLFERLAAWPSDAFAATSAILGESGAYRLIVSPPPDCEWPPRDAEEWRLQVKDAKQAWLAWCTEDIAARARGQAGAGTQSSAAELVTAVSSILDVALDVLGSHKANEMEWDRLCRLFHLHAVADEACSGLGLDVRNPATAVCEFRANDMLANAGSSSTFPPDRVRVLPKMRTPQIGVSLRSLSHNASFSRCEVDVRWRRFDYPTPRDRKDRLRVLIFPWPFEVREADFVEVGGPLRNLDLDKFGFFDFRPRYPRDALLGPFKQAILGSRDYAGEVADAVVLPECAVTTEEFDDLWAVCKAESVKVLLAGVRGPRLNAAHLRIGDGNEKLFVQHKHHRWCLDESQVRTYGLGAALNPTRRWWEATDLQRRGLTFVAFNEWLTLCHLICEDLARIDPVAQVVRAVGPTLLIALLLDGPQIAKRWSARYASVLADDPGTSVLSVTSLGMALRSRVTPTDPSNRTIAFWRDAKDGHREIELADGALGVLLTLWPNWVEEFAADGRPDGAVAGRVIFGGYTQVR